MNHIRISAAWPFSFLDVAFYDWRGAMRRDVWMDESDAALGERN